jgi:peptidoglycan/xylan/chitin deacetylase (PgdA/CDA1 family)
MDFIKQALIQSASAIGLFKFLRWRHRTNILALTYHGIVDISTNEIDKYPFLYRNCLRADLFEEQMLYLKRCYNILSAYDLEGYIERNRAPLTRAVVITFDDGLLNNATVAWPILQKLEIPALFFLPTGFVDAASKGELRFQWTEEIAALVLTNSEIRNKRYGSIIDAVPELKNYPHGFDMNILTEMLIAILKGFSCSDLTKRLSKLRRNLGNTVDPMSFPADQAGGSLFATMNWDHARKMRESGMEIGSHTVNHTSLTSLTEYEAKWEIVHSMDRIQAEVRVPCRFFSYPYGTLKDFSAVHRAILSESGLLSAFTQLYGINIRSNDPYTLCRTDVSATRTLKHFLFCLSGLR